MAEDRQPVANGIRTDHPIPKLPFVDDSHIDVADPAAIEAVGRDAGKGMWGRHDMDPASGEWWVYTTDPKNHRYAWVVRFHPDHGRSVTLYRNEGASGVHQRWFRERPLLERAGGYWWDGTTWYRPSQVLSWSSETYMRRPARQPVTITAADLADNSSRVDQGHLHTVIQLEPGTTVTNQQWGHDLALWNSRRESQDAALPADRCVVTLNAPELSDAALLGVEEFAVEAGMGAATLRAYISRGEGNVPAPQVSDGGRKRWSRPVIDDWLEQRGRETSTVETMLHDDPEQQVSPGLSTLWKRITEAVFGQLWEPPSSRRRWSRTHRTEEAARALAAQVGWTAALHLESAVPFSGVAEALEHTILWQMREGPGTLNFIGLYPETSRLLGWYLNHQPGEAPRLFGGIVREAEIQLGISPAITAGTLTTALRIDGGFKDQQEKLEAFIAAALPPDK